MAAQSAGSHGGGSAAADSGACGSISPSCASRASAVAVNTLETLARRKRVLASTGRC